MLEAIYGALERPGAGHHDLATPATPGAPRAPSSQGNPERGPSAKHRPGMDSNSAMCNAEGVKYAGPARTRNAARKGSNRQFPREPGVGPSAKHQPGRITKKQCATQKGPNREALREREIQRGRGQIGTSQGNPEWIPAQSVNQAGIQRMPCATWKAQTGRPCDNAKCNAEWGQICSSQPQGTPSGPQFKSTTRQDST